MIVQLEEAKVKLKELEENIKELGDAIKINDLREKSAELEQLTFEQDFWSDQERSGKILRELKQIKDKITEYEKLASSLEDAQTLCEMGIEEDDASVVDEVTEEVRKIEKEETYEEKNSARCGELVR